MKPIAVVILNWNGEHLLRKFLPSVVAHSPEADIYVVDNCSTDGSYRVLSQEFPEVFVISHMKNLGFSEGYNAGIDMIGNEWLVLLNSDVEVTEGWLAPILAMAEANPNIAAIQPKLLDYTNRSRFEYAGAAGGYIDYLGYAFNMGRLFDECEEDKGQYQHARPVVWGSGAALFINRNVYKSLKGLDKSYFAHWEEIDLCWRIWRSGYEVWYCPDSAVYHLGGGSLKKGSPQKTFLNYRNNLCTMVKNMALRKLLWVIPVRLVLDGMSGALWLLKLQPLHMLAIIHAHFSFYGMIPSMLAKRKIKRLGKSYYDWRKLFYPQSVVWAHFAKKQMHIAPWPSISPK